MADSRLDIWARTIVNFCVKVEAGQSVVITGGIASEPLMRAVFREVVKAGAHPITLPTFNGIAAELLSHGSDEQLTYISPVERFLRTEADIVISIMAETNTKALAGVDPARQQLHAGARAELFKTFLEREEQGKLRWTLTLYPTDAYAQDADLSTADYAEFVYSACKLDQPDPVAAWNEQAAMQERLIEWLKGKEQLHVTGPGTDLRLSVANRTWINADGTSNFPDGEIFTGPVEDSVEGVISFTYPAVIAGREASGIVLRFEKGKVVEASAEKGNDYLQRVLDTDAGARYMGEFAIGTNFDIQRFTKNILFDEKIGGTVHMAIGQGYPLTGNTNQSAVHWDMVCDLREGGQVTVDGEVLLKDGKIVV